MDLNEQLRQLIRQQEAKDKDKDKDNTGKQNFSLNGLGDTESLGGDSSPMNCIPLMAGQGNSFSGMSDRHQRSSSLEKYCKSHDVIPEQASDIIVEKKIHVGSHGNLGHIKEVNET